MGSADRTALPLTRAQLKRDVGCHWIALLISVGVAICAAAQAGDVQRPCSDGVPQSGRWQLPTPRLAAYHYDSGLLAATGREYPVGNWLARTNLFHPWGRYLRVGKWAFWHENGQFLGSVEFEIGWCWRCGPFGLEPRAYDMPVGRIELWHDNGQKMVDGHFIARAERIENDCEGGASVCVPWPSDDTRYWDAEGHHISREELVSRYEGLRAWWLRWFGGA